MGPASTRSALAEDGHPRQPCEEKEECCKTGPGPQEGTGQHDPKGLACNGTD